MLIFLRALTLAVLQLNNNILFHLSCDCGVLFRGHICFRNHLEKSLKDILCAMMIFSGWNTVNDISCAAVISNLKKYMRWKLCWY